MDMEKKNPYVTTIGFNRKDPNHVRVAEFLNKMGRGKAQYIVNAVMAYQNEEKTKDGFNLDYREIRKVIQEIMEEKEGCIIHKTSKYDRNCSFENNSMNLREQHRTDILDSINLFKG